MNRRSLLHYLTAEEEGRIKANIPWDSIDRKVRDLIRIANGILGLATLQSCAGHVHPTEEGFYVSSAQVAFRATAEITRRVIFEIAPEVGIQDIGLRYFDDGTFWLCVEADPSERGKLYDLFRALSANT